jgi:predicted dehydrogenase
MPDRFRLALIGAGMITQGSHLPAALASDKVQVAAIVDPELGRAAALANAYRIKPMICTSADQVIGHVDGAIIATPNHTHRDVAAACLQAGIGTLIEKPLAGSVSDGEAILSAALSTRSTVAVGYSTRFRNSTRLLHALITSNRFGSTRRFAHQFGTAGGWAPRSGYNLHRRSAGGGVLIVSGSHFIDRMLYIWGFPTAARFEDDSLGGVEANCVASFVFGTEPNSIVGVARYSKTFSFPAGLVIETEQGILSLADNDDAEIDFTPADSPHLTYSIHATDGPRTQTDCFLLQLEYFVDACMDRRPPLVDGEQGLQSLRLIERLYSARHSIDQVWYE